MKTGNFSRALITEAYTEFPWPVTDDDWLISITDAGWHDAEVKKPFGRILFTHFNDTQTEGEGEIQDEQALEIANFIKEARALKKNVWANCHAGICRSGAIVAICADLGWIPQKHPTIPTRLPNSLVYNKIRVHFDELKHSWDVAGKETIDEWMNTVWKP